MKGNRSAWSCLCSPFLRVSVCCLVAACLATLLALVLCPRLALAQDARKALDSDPGPGQTLSGGGPDPFGYTYLDSTEPGGPVYAWEEISGTGTQVTGWTSYDDGYAGPVPIGFTFNYYGANYSELYVGTNGYLSFGQGDGAIPWGSLPSTNQPNNDIALFGGDMYLYDYGIDSVVYYQVLAGPERLVVEFVNLYYCCSQNTAHTFEVILYANGDIKAQYQALNGTSTSYAGIENVDGTAGLGYTGTMADSLAILYAYPVGVSLLPASQQGSGDPGTTVTYTLTLINRTGATDSFDLSLQPGYAWPTALSLAQTGSLADGESVSFTAQVQVPPAAVPGDADTAIILAASASAPAVYTDTATITTYSRGDLAYVTVSDNDLVALVDTVTHDVLGTIPLDSAGCDFPWRAAMTPDGAQVWVACDFSGSAIVIDTGTNTVIQSVFGIPNANGIAFTRDGAYALIGSRNYGQIAVVDTSTYVISMIPTPSFPRSVAVHPYLPRAYATSADGTLLVLDLTTFTIAGSVVVGSNPWDVAVSADGQWVFTGDRNGAGLAVVNAQTNSLFTTVTGLGNLTGLEVAPDGSQLYACSLWEGVRILDGSTFELLATVDTDGESWEAAVTCDGGKLFVGDTNDLVPVIDTAARTLIENIAVPGWGARGIAICPQAAAEGVLLHPPTQTNRGGHGQVVVHPVTVVNATGATDSFALALGSHAWDSALSTTLIGPLANGQSAAFDVSVTVPPGADWYATDTVVVTATSVASPTEYLDTAAVTTEAYAPPQVGVSPDSLSSTQLVNEVVIRSLTISNGDGVTLAYSISPFAAGSGVSFAAVSTELYGYDMPVAWLRVIGTEDDTEVHVIDLATGAIIAQNPDLDRYAIWDVYPADDTAFKVEASKRVAAYESDFNYTWGHTTFVPSLDSGAIGTEFIFYYHVGMYDGAVYVFALDDATVEIRDPSGALVATRTMPAASYWQLSLGNGVYHATSTGRIAVETVGTNGYSTVPGATGTGPSDWHFFATTGSGALAVFAYEEVDLVVWDLDLGEPLYTHHLAQGEYVWWADMGTRRLALESTGSVEVWAGDYEGGYGIEYLGDDISFAAGVNGQEYYVHSLMDGSVIFAPFDNTAVDVDGVVYHLAKDEYLHLPGCCYLRHIVSTRPILIQTLGRDSQWNDLGSYLGGVTAAGAVVPWLAVDPISGTVPSNSSGAVEVTLDATEIQPGEYTAGLSVVSNDPVHPSVVVPVTMTVLPTANMGWVEGTVTDQATGEPLAAALVAVGQPYTVYSDPDTGYYRLWLDAGSYTLEASAPGYVSGSAQVTIVAQQGVTHDFALVFDVPVMRVTPDSLQVTQHVGDVATRAMTITNAGPADLTFEVNLPLDVSALEDVLDRLNSNYQTVIDAIPNRFDFDEGETGYFINDGGLDMYDMGNYLSTNLGAYIQYSNNLIVDGWLFGPSGRYFTRKYPGLFVMAADMEQVDFFAITGNLGADGSGSVDATILETSMYGVTYYGFVKRVYNAGDPSVNHLIIVAASPTANHSFSWDTNDDFHEVTGLAPTTRLYYLLYAGTNGAYIDDGATLNLMETFLHSIGLASAAPWLSVSPISGTVPGYASLPVQVTFDAAGLQPGDYESGIWIESNDPVTPTVQVAARMTVLPSADMGRVTGRVSDAWTGQPLTATVELAGVYAVTADPGYTIWAPAGSYTLLAYTSGYYTVTRSVEIAAGEVVTADLALEPAQARLELSPSQITATVVAGRQTRQALLIANTGPLALDVALYEISPTLALRAPSPQDLNGIRILYDRAHGEPEIFYFGSLVGDLVAAGAIVTESWALPVTPAVLAGYDIVWVNCCGGTIWSYGELSALDDWLDEGGALLVHGQSSASTEGPPTILGVSYQPGSCMEANTTNIQPHPISSGVDSVYISWTCVHLAPGDHDVVVYDPLDQPHVVAAEQDGGKMVVLAAEDFYDWDIDFQDNRLLANNIFAWLARPAYTDVPWLSVTPQAATINGHSSLPITLGFDATDLPVGVYEAILAVEHTDPAIPSPLDVPVTLNVVASRPVYLPIVYKHTE